MSIVLIVNKKTKQMSLLWMERVDTCNQNTIRSRSIW